MGAAQPAARSLVLQVRVLFFQLFQSPLGLQCIEGALEFSDDPFRGAFVERLIQLVGSEGIDAFVTGSVDARLDGEQAERLPAHDDPVDPQHFDAIRIG